MLRLPRGNGKMAVAVSVTTKELIDLDLIDFSLKAWHVTATAIFPLPLGTLHVLLVAVGLFHTSYCHFASCP